MQIQRAIAALPVIGKAQRHLIDPVNRMRELPGVGVGERDSIVECFGFQLIGVSLDAGQGQPPDQTG